MSNLLSSYVIFLVMPKITKDMHTVNTAKLKYHIYIEYKWIQITIWCFKESNIEIWQCRVMQNNGV